MKRGLNGSDFSRRFQFSVWTAEPSAGWLYAFGSFPASHDIGTSLSVLGLYLIACCKGGEWQWGTQSPLGIGELGVPWDKARAVGGKLIVYSWVCLHCGLNQLEDVAIDR